MNDDTLLPKVKKICELKNVQLKHLYNKPELKNLPGWKQDIRGIINYEELPEACRNYIEFIEGEIGYPITMVSNGPGREDIIHRESALSK